MAKLVDYNFLPSLTIPGSYWMVGEIRLSPFHQTCEIDFYAFISEDARRQRLSDSETELHRPLKIHTMRTTYDLYERYIKVAADGLIAAGYRWASEESAGISERGLKELLDGAADI